MLDTTGRLLNYKLIRGTNGLNFSINYIQAFDSSKLLLSLSVSDSVLYVNNHAVPVLSGSTPNSLLISTDTSYTQLTSKVLNTPGQIIIGTNASSGANFFPLTNTHDSVYLVVNSQNPDYYAQDGFKVPVMNRNVLVVLDKALHTSWVVDLGSSIVTPNIRRLYFKAIAVLDSNLILNGYYTGTNESPNKVIPVKDSTISITPSCKTSIDMNGASRSFIVKTDLGIQESQLKWLGDHSEYEQSRLDVAFLKAQHSKIYFAHTIDNVWNPWIMNDSLQVIQGRMRPNADRPNVKRYSRII